MPLPRPPRVSARSSLSPAAKPHSQAAKPAQPCHNPSRAISVQGSNRTCAVSQMARKSQAKAKAISLPVGQSQPKQQQATRKPNGQWAKGYSGWSGAADAARARRDLNLATIGGMREAFDKYGRSAIEKVAKTQPAIFLKMLVLLVPRELEVTHTGGVKAMSDEQLEATINAVQGMLAKRDAAMVDVTPSPAPVPVPGPPRDTSGTPGG